MKHNNDFRYDLKVGQVYETQLADIFANKKVEVKRDFLAAETGNIFIEYQSRGKKSGISISQADYYCFWLSEFHCAIIKTEFLKDICRQYIGTEHDVLGGDSNTSKGILLPVNELF
jgi:hypothetical protein